MISADLLELLRCPVTGQRLQVADATMLAKANALTNATDRGQRGNRLPSGLGAITAALVSADQKMLYPLREGIPMLLAEAAVVL